MKIIDAFVLHLLLRAWSTKNLQTPNLSPMANDAITRDVIRGLESPLYICVFGFKKIQDKRNTSL